MMSEENSKWSENSLDKTSGLDITEYEQLLERIVLLGQSLNAARDLAGVFQAIKEYVVASTLCDRLFVSLYDKQRNDWRYVFAFIDSIQVDAEELYTVPLTENPHARAIKTNTLIIEYDLQKANVSPQINTKDMRAPRSLLVVPMSVLGSVTGAIELQSVKPNVFAPEHATAMRMAANLVAAAIENVRLLEQDREKDAQLLQAQKMEAIGRLAGGVAHDFNNLLTAIIGYSDLSLHSSGQEEYLRRNIREIRRAGERAAQLTRQLLAFSRKQILHARVINLNNVISEIEKMLNRLIGENIEIQTFLDSSLRPIKADSGQIEQIILNLAVNARDAMPAGGKLVFTTTNVEINEEYTDISQDVQWGSYSMLTVSDSGYGMTPEVQKRIFEPFFTTKEVGKGTGLGLSTVYGIVKQSNGYIWVHSEVNKGTTFRIYLPSVNDEADERNEREPSDESRGTETILLAEDEEVVRKLSREILEGRGYTVLEAAEVVEAVRICESHDGTIHLLLTDVVMPQMSGMELAYRLRCIRPEIKVLFMSGYSDDGLPLHNILDKTHRFIGKPFAASDLLRKVRKVLTSPAETQQIESADSPVEVNLNELNNPSEGSSLESDEKWSPSPLVEVAVQDGTSSKHTDAKAQQIIRILIIDDDNTNLRYIERALKSNGYAVSTAASGLRGIELAQDFSPNIVLTDYRMSELNGIQTLQGIRPIVPDAIPILMTAYPEIDVITEAVRQLVSDVLIKPFTPTELLNSIENAIFRLESRERDRRHRDFLSIISHELRAPLQGPLSYIDQLLSGGYGQLNDIQRERMRRAEQGLKTHIQLVNNLLNLTYLESGRFQVNLSPGYLEDAVQEVVTSFEVQANSNGIEICWSVPKDDFLVTHDADFFKQALRNILTNALQHTPRGKRIKLQLKRRADTVFCSVRDEGGGIPVVHQERIFEKSYQAPSPTPKKGLGMGLYIARMIIRDQGGDIAVRSQPGKGSSFTIMLPYGKKTKG